MDQYLSNLKHTISTARSLPALNEIKKIAKRRLNKITSNPNTKASFKKSAKKQYKSIIREIKRQQGRL